MKEDKFDRIKHILREIPFFEEFSDDDIDFFSGNLSLRFFDPPTVLFEEGDIGDFLFFVVEGKVEVRLKSADARHLIVAAFKRGSCVGEMSLIDDYPRSATVIVTEPSELLLLSRNRFESICRENPSVGFKFQRGIAKNLSVRLRKTTGRFADLA